MSITFSPHTTADVNKILGDISSRITQGVVRPHGSVLFAVMQLTGSDTPVYNTLASSTRPNLSSVFASLIPTIARLLPA